MTVLPGVVNLDFRKDLENETFAQWLGTPKDAQEILEIELRKLLVAHARAAVFMTLRRADPDLVTEAVNRVMLNLGNFKGDAKFTTWAHRIIMNLMYDQRRQERFRREVSMDVPGFDLPGEPTTDMTNVILTVRQVLSDAQYKIFEEVVLLGYSHAEAAERLSMTKPTLTRKWETITGVLQNAFSK